MGMGSHQKCAKAFGGYERTQQRGAANPCYAQSAWRPKGTKKCANVLLMALFVDAARVCRGCSCFKPADRLFPLLSLEKVPSPVQETLYDNIR